MYADNLWMGQKYEHLKKCITISILDFKQIPGEKNHSVFTLRDAEGKEWTDLFEIHVIELQKQLVGDSPLNDWIRLFNATCEEDLDMIQSKSKGMTEAMEAVRTMGLVKNLRWMFEQRQKAMRDRWAEDDFIREKSEAKGRAEGVITGTRDAIIKVLGTFGEVPEHLRLRIMSEQNTEILDQMLQDAAKIREIQEFADKWC